MSGRDEHIRREVEASLKQASDLQLARIMQFIDRLPSRIKLDAVVEQVRGRLALVRPARSMTLLRVLTQPFEDLLVGADLAATSPWYVPRDLIAFFGGHTLTALPETDRRRLNALTENRTMDDQGAMLAAGAVLWPTAQQALNKAYADGQLNDLDETRRRALLGVAQLMEHAEEIVTFMDQLPPRPMPRLREDERGAAMSLMYSLGQSSADLFRYAFTMLVRRSSEPMEFFDLLLSADFGIPSETRDALLKEAAHECLREVDVMGRDMDATPDRSVAAGAEAALRMASLIESLESAPPQVKLNPKQLAETKRRASSSVAKTYQGALSGEMFAAFQTVAAPPQSDVAADEEVARAEIAARATRKLGMAGDRLGAGDDIERAMSGQFANYRDQIIDKAAKVRGPRMARLSKVMDEVRLVEIVFGADAAGELIRNVE